MLEVAPGWSLDVARGPDSLFVRLHVTKADLMDATGLADAIWGMLQQQFAHRLVLEMEDLPLLPSSLMAELVRLYKRLHSNGGLLRLCGLNEESLNVLRLTRLQSCLPNYNSREEAVMGVRPKPR